MNREYFVGQEVGLPADLICEDEDGFGVIVAVCGAELIVRLYKCGGTVTVFAHEVY